MKGTVEKIVDMLCGLETRDLRRKAGGGSDEGVEVPLR